MTANPHQRAPFPPPDASDSLSSQSDSLSASLMDGRRVSPALVLIGVTLCALATAAALGILGGVASGNSAREVQATQTATAELEMQLLLGQADLEQGRYELAAQRFRWILERIPDHPEASQGLAETERLMTSSASEPTLVPSVSGDPAEIFAQAQSYFENGEWENAITRLYELQALDPTYEAITATEMLHTALVTLGLQYIRGDRIEEGMLLLDQAAEIRPLDDITEGERRLANLYVIGRTYWNIDWKITIVNFEAIYELAPNYRDVAERLWEAYVRYAEQLTRAGDPCGAAEGYTAALALRADSVIREKRDAAALLCETGAPTPSADPLETLTPEPPE